MPIHHLRDETGFLSARTDDRFGARLRFNRVHTGTSGGFHNRTNPSAAVLVFFATKCRVVGVSLSFLTRI